MSDNNDEILLGKKLDLLLRTGQLLIQSLGDSNRVDRNLRRVALFMGISADKFHMHINYTTLMINVSDEHHSITKFRKCANHGVNMDTLAKISNLTWTAFEKNYSLEEYERDLNEIANAKKNYPRWLIILGIGFACGGFCKLFGCDWFAFFTTAIASSFAIFCRQEMHHRNLNMYLNIAFSATIAVLIAGAGTLLGISSTPLHPIFASVLFLIPGVPIINCLDDMIDGFSIVGMTRAIIVFITLGAISFGMVLSIKMLSLEDHHHTLLPQAKLLPIDGWIVISLAAAVAATGFAMLFNVPIKTLIICALGGAVAVVTRNVLHYHAGFGLPLSSFCGALVVGIVSIYLVLKVHVPAHVISIPPVIPMIPGVLMYKAMIGILGISNVAATDQLPLLFQTLESGINATLTVIGISLGVAIPNVIGRKYFSDSTYKKRLEELIKN